MTMTIISCFLWEKKKKEHHTGDVSKSHICKAHDVIVPFSVVRHMAKIFGLILGTAVQQRFGSGEENLEKSEEKH